MNQSPEQREDRILHRMTCTQYCNTETCEVMQWKAVEIQAAVEGATRETLKVRDHDVKIAVENGIKMEAEAYEDAAKIVIGDWQCDNDECSHYAEDECIVRKIRARAKELK